MAQFLFTIIISVYFTIAHTYFAYNLSIQIIKMKNKSLNQSFKIGNADPFDQLVGKIVFGGMMGPFSF